MSQDILLSLIDPDPDQPRKYFDEGKLEELAQSIQSNGLAVPILVRPSGERFIIVHGERRYKAARSLGWESIPAEVREIEADEAKWLQLIENIQRSDLTAIEEGELYKSALASQKMTQAELAQKIGKSQGYIATKLRYLKLPEPIQEKLADGRISEGQLKQIMRLSEYPLLRDWILDVVAYKGTTVQNCRTGVDEVLSLIRYGSYIANDEWDKANKMREIYFPDDTHAVTAIYNGMMLAAQLELNWEPLTEAGKSPDWDLQCSALVWLMLAEKDNDAPEYYKDCVKMFMLVMDIKDDSLCWASGKMKDVIRENFYNT